MPFILLGVGVLIVGLALLLPEKTPSQEKKKGDADRSFSETASSFTGFHDDLNAKLDDFLGELESNLSLAGERLEATITKLTSLQDALSTPLAPEKDESKTQHLPQKHRDVLGLRAKGLNVEEIATRLNIGKGEVELILALYEAGDKH